MKMTFVSVDPQLAAEQERLQQLLNLDEMGEEEGEGEEFQVGLSVHGSHQWWTLDLAKGTAKGEPSLVTHWFIAAYEIRKKIKHLSQMGMAQ